MKVNEANNREPEAKPIGGMPPSGEQTNPPSGNALLDGLKLAIKIFVWFLVGLVGLLLVIIAVLYAGCVLASGGRH